MKVRELVFAAIRILSIYVIIQGLMRLSSLLTWVIQPSGLHDIRYQLATLAAVVLLMGLIIVVMGVILWKYAEKLTNRILRPTNEEEDSVALERSDLYSLGLTLTGVVLLVNAIPALISQLWNIGLLYEPGQSAFALSQLTQLWIGVVAGLAKLVLALILMIGSRGLTRLVGRIRDAGLPPRQ